MFKSQSFTGGHWRVSDSPEAIPNAKAIKTTSNIYVALCYCEGAEFAQAEATEVEANARLIATAPELLNALRQLLNDPNSLKAKEQAFSVITKALGGADAY